MMMEARNRKECKIGISTQLGISFDNAAYYLCLEENGQIRKLAIFKSKQAVKDFVKCIKILEGEGDEGGWPCKKQKLNGATLLGIL